MRAADVTPSMRRLRGRRWLPALSTLVAVVTATVLLVFLLPSGAASSGKPAPNGAQGRQMAVPDAPDGASRAPNAAPVSQSNRQNVSASTPGQPNH